MEKDIHRIECYDVSNIQGKQATGSMIVFVDGKPDKSQYKKFKIKMKNEPNDIAMLKETIERRLSHKEWPYPEVMLIDGGIAQLNIAIFVKNLKRETKCIKVISIAKRNRVLYIEQKQPILLKTLPREIFNLILQLDAQAHRFALSYHKKLRKKQLLH
jgi:excinuclease ABC subunit C